MVSGVIPWWRRTLVAVAAALVLTTGACARAEPGVVVYVGDTKITQRQLDQAIHGIESTLTAGQSVSTEAVINAMIHGELAAQIAAKENLPITEADRLAVLKDSNLASLINVPDARPVIDDVADTQIVSKKLGTRYLTEISKIKVTLNPRFGVLDPSQQTIISDQSGSLSRPVTSPTP
jgi:hypothetical protein